MRQTPWHWVQYVWFILWKMQVRQGTTNSHWKITTTLCTQIISELQISCNTIRRKLASECKSALQWRIQVAKECALIICKKCVEVEVCGFGQCKQAQHVDHMVTIVSEKYETAEGHKKFCISKQKTACPYSRLPRFDGAKVMHKSLYARQATCNVASHGTWLLLNHLMPNMQRCHWNCEEIFLNVGFDTFTWHGISIGIGQSRERTLAHPSWGRENMSAGSNACFLAAW